MKTVDELNSRIETLQTQIEQLEMDKLSLNITISDLVNENVKLKKENEELLHQLSKLDDAYNLIKAYLSRTT